MKKGVFTSVCKIILWQHVNRDDLMAVASCVKARLQCYGVQRARDLPEGAHEEFLQFLMSLQIDGHKVRCRVPAGRRVF